ncbi:MBL fold metallo-hydrolase [candidate division KSB1 bacterium]|nr:MBL fold metallo-hydrolase [candidate division KSB1 bacterium]
MPYLSLKRRFWLLLMTIGASAISAPPTLTPASELPAAPVVVIHYLGHAAFFLQFDNGVSVLTDYGQSNAYGLDSPIYELVGIEPDIVTFSHHHPDHHRPGVEFGQARSLTNTDSLSLKGLKITPIRTAEATPFSADNTSYLFTYKGLKILHLADAQAYITAIDQDSIKQQLAHLYPDKYDLLLMTIQGVSQFIPQAEAFIDLLRPVRVIPMHYWSPAYKADFLAYLRAQNQQANKPYKIEATGRADFALDVGDEAEPIQIISLEPAARSQPK